MSPEGSLKGFNKPISIDAGFEDKAAKRGCHVSSGVLSAVTVGVCHEALPQLSRIRLSVRREQNPVSSIRLSISIDPTFYDCLFEACGREAMMQQ